MMNCPHAMRKALFHKNVKNEKKNFTLKLNRGGTHRQHSVPVQPSASFQTSFGHLPAESVPTAVA